MPSLSWTLPPFHHLACIRLGTHPRLPPFDVFLIYERGPIHLHASGRGATFEAALAQALATITTLIERSPPDAFAELDLDL